jgi:hypothetical protein
MSPVLFCSLPQRPANHVSRRWGGSAAIYQVVRPAGKRGQRAGLGWVNIPAIHQNSLSQYIVPCFGRFANRYKFQIYSPAPFQSTTF